MTSESIALWVCPSKGCHTLRIVPPRRPSRYAALLAGAVLLGLLALALALSSGSGKGVLLAGREQHRGSDAFDGAALPAPHVRPLISRCAIRADGRWR